MSKSLDNLFGSDHGLDPKSVKFLTNALEKNNLPGFDYLEFKQSLTALAAMNMDQETAIKSAFATASTMGLTKDKLVETSQHYVQVLDNEKKSFTDAMQKRLQQRVTGKQDEVNKLKGQIEQHREKIRQLEEQITKWQNTIDTADETINAEKTKIEETRDQFETAHQAILNEIRKDQDTIKGVL